MSLWLVWLGVAGGAFFDWPVARLNRPLGRALSTDACELMGSHVGSDHENTQSWKLPSTFLDEKLFHQKSGLIARAKVVSFCLFRRSFSRAVQSYHHVSRLPETLIVSFVVNSVGFDRFSPLNHLPPPGKESPDVLGSRLVRRNPFRITRGIHSRNIRSDLELLFCCQIILNSAAFDFHSAPLLAPQQQSRWVFNLTVRPALHPRTALRVSLSPRRLTLCADYPSLRGGIATPALPP